jgi:hypothetical protein
LHAGLTTIVVAGHGALVLGGRVGLQAQLTTGVSTPSGVGALLAGAAPTLTMVLCACAIRTRRFVAWSLGLVFVETLVLAYSGFRGHAVSYLIGLGALLLVVVPSDNEWRSRRRARWVAVVLAGTVVGAFALGVGARSNIATQLGASSAGTQTFAVSEALDVVTARLALIDPLQMAIDGRDDWALVDAVRWPDQLVGVVPRALWPDKPVLNYGQRISVAIYGPAYSRTSSTITGLGDSLINFGRAGVAVVALVIGWAVVRLEGFVRRTATRPMTMVLGASLASYAMNQEVPVILGLISTMQTAITTFVLWIACSSVDRLVRERVPQRPAHDLDRLPRRFGWNARARSR